jgi:hypothetical protein
LRVFRGWFGKLFAAQSGFGPFTEQLREAFSACGLQILHWSSGWNPLKKTTGEELIMKSLLFFIALLCIVTLTTSSAPTATPSANTGNKERAVIRFSQPVELMGVTLGGSYLFVHDDEAMARGEDCTSVYKGVAEIPNKLVVSFHCMPAARATAEKFTVRTMLTVTGQYEVREFQFAGSTEAHLVPVTPQRAHVNIATME